MLYYKAQRINLIQNEPITRAVCWTCRKPSKICYCANLRPFRTSIDFVFLVDPPEDRRHIASARMAHLNLIGSHYFVGTDFVRHREVVALLAESSRSNWLLFPGPEALALDQSGAAEAFWGHIGPERQATVYVIDAKWSRVKRMVEAFDCLRKLPRIAFTPPRPSRFRIRKQPSANCWSTLEAIDYTIVRTKAAAAEERQVLLECFDTMVEQQINFQRSSGVRSHQAIPKQK